MTAKIDTNMVKSRLKLLQNLNLNIKIGNVWSDPSKKWTFFLNEEKDSKVMSTREAYFYLTGIFDSIDLLNRI